MKTFRGFNKEGDPCPICRTCINKETLLFPIPGTEEGNFAQAFQVHKDCYKNFVDSQKIQCD